MIKFCSLYSGSSGNSIFIEANGTKILIDAGLSGKKIIQALNSIGERPSDISAILVTHEHSDHIRGVGILSRMFNIPVYANEKTWEAISTQIGPVSADNMRCFVTGKEFEIGNMCIRPFPIPHDAVEPVGFNFFAFNRKVTTATDIGHITEEILESLVKSDLVLLESNHDIEMLKVGPYPWPLKMRVLGDKGHLSNEMAGKVAVHLAERGTCRFLLGHLSRENNFPELAYQTVYNALRESKIKVDSDVMLEVALRDCTSRVMTL